ncbi:hypothetical protein [Methanobrevibacter cuticularis]|nr:hypothetical protein [Methanobrevibacter cuticularis]
MKKCGVFSKIRKCELNFFHYLVHYWRLFENNTLETLLDEFFIDN